MPGGDHPSLGRETAWVIVAFIIRDVFAYNSEMQDSVRVRTLLQLQTLRRFVRKKAEPRHLLRLGPGHTAEFRIPV